MKILVVDDEADVRRIATLSLTHVGGFAVIEATGGREAIEKAVDEEPDAILLDVMMPGMDGVETLSALRRDDRTKAIPIVFVTARAMANEVSRLKDQGAAGVLTKPFNAMTLPAELLEVLHAVR